MKIKWIFTFIWIVSIIAFIVGQLLAPPNYASLSGNPWGQLFGWAIVIGVIAFVSMIVSVIVSKRDKVQLKRSIKDHPKYDLSISRIFSRLIIAGIVAVVFISAMMPFLTRADGLLFTQRSAIGGENMVRMVALWGIFTLIISFATFLKKHFRMVSVFLIICWLLGVAFVLMLAMYENNNFRCNRSSPYLLPNEFNRSLDLISQRMGVDKTAVGSVWQSAFNYRNCFDIQYLSADDSEAEAYFKYQDDSNLQDLKVFVNPSYKNFDDLTLAALLAHEITHVGQHINEVSLKIKMTCYEKEANAFTAQLAFISSLNAEERRSIYTRIQDNVDKNPTFKTIILASQRESEAYNACLRLQKQNALTTDQLNECTWTGTQNKLLMDIQNDSYYQRQCENR